MVRPAWGGCIWDMFCMRGSKVNNGPFLWIVPNGVAAWAEGNRVGKSRRGKGREGLRDGKRERGRYLRRLSPCGMGYYELFVFNDHLSGCKVSGIEENTQTRVHLPCESREFHLPGESDCCNKKATLIYYTPISGESSRNYTVVRFQVELGHMHYYFKQVRIYIREGKRSRWHIQQGVVMIIRKPPVTVCCSRNLIRKTLTGMTSVGYNI